jgi:glycosyltransferase involved in cell wall biosynthesis
VSVRLAIYTDSSILGGAERGARSLIAHLGAHVDVTVLGPSRETIRALAAVRPGTRTLVVPGIGGKWDMRGAGRFARALDAAGADVVQFVLPSPWACRHEIAVASAFPGLRVVAVENLPLPMPDPHARRVKRLLSRRLDAHVAVGYRAAREVERYAGLPPDSVQTIELAVDDFALELDNRPRARPRIGTTVRLDRQKGIDVLLGALPLLPGVDLELVGDGPERESLERLAATADVADRVRFAGWSEDARSWLSRWDLFVLPSRHEGLPLAILDAMLAGLPIVAADVGSVSEAVVHEETGLLVRPGDVEGLAAAIRRLLEDHQLARRLGARAQAMGRERFLADRMARRYEVLYAQLLAGADHRPLRTLPGCPSRPR